jgi:4-amino-4-deoxy-L-arabinose transferase-like glycosyltransferase
LAFILILALALRLINLGERNLWYDEAFAVLFAEKGLDAMLYGTLAPVAGGAADIHPLLYYSTLNIWMAIFGQSAFAVRLWSVTLGVATVALIYLLGRALWDERTGLLAAFITGVAPFHVQYSQETRMYALLGLLLMAATWCFIKGWRAAERPWRWWAAFGVLAALAMYTQQLAAFYLAALGLVPVLPRRRTAVIGVVMGAAVAIIVYLPWLVNLPGQFAKVRSYYWIDTPGIAQILRTTFSFLVVNLDIPRTWFLIGLLAAIFVTIFLAVQTIIYLRGHHASDRNTIRFVLWLALAPPALMWLVSQFQPVYLERSLLPSALMLYLALAWLFTRSRLPRPIEGIIAGVGIIMVGVGLYHQYTWSHFPNSPYRQAVAAIRVRWQTGDVIVHQNKLTALPMIYYGRELPQRYLADKPGSPEDTLALPTQESLKLPADNCIQTARRDGGRVWWVVYDFAAKQYQAAGRAAEFIQPAQWLAAHYQPANEQLFNDLHVMLYDHPRGDVTTSECPPA